MSALRVALSVIACAAAGCGGGDTLVASTSFPLSEMSGTGPSPLDPLYQQTIAFEVELPAPTTGNDTVDMCRTTVYEQMMPPATASGATATTVQTEILALLKAWDVTLALCSDPAQSSVTLHSDNEAGLAVIVGCLTVPPSAQRRDKNGNPVWSDFTASACQATVYDQLHGRLFNSRDFSMTISLR